MTKPSSYSRKNKQRNQALKSHQEQSVFFLGKFDIESLSEQREQIDNNKKRECKQ